MILIICFFFLYACEAGFFAHHYTGVYYEFMRFFLPAGEMGFFFG